MTLFCVHCPPHAPFAPRPLRPSPLYYPSLTPHMSERWVPFMFGLAGLIIGVGYPLLDDLVDGGSRPSGLADDRSSRSGGLAGDGLQQPGGGGRSQAAAGGGASAAAVAAAPSWPAVLLTISLFVFHYKLSAVLDAPLAGVPGAEDAVLAAAAVAMWRVLDGTPQVRLSIAHRIACCGPPRKRPPPHLPVHVCVCC
jgi:hypothetical protein